MVSSVLGSVVLLAIAAYLTRWFFQWQRLSHIPGPTFAALSKFWLIRVGLKGRSAHAFKELQDRYGSLIRVGPNEVVTGDPEVLRRMMAVRSEYTRGPWYEAMKAEPGKNNLLSMRDDVAHTKLKNKMAAGYSGKENESMEGTIDKQISRFISLLEKKYVSTAEDYRPVNFAEKVQFFTLDIISDLAFGKPFGYLENNADVFDYIKITNAYVPIMVFLGNVPKIANLLHSRFFRALLPSESDKLGFGAFIGVAKKVVAERFASPPRNDMLGSFIRHGLTQDEASGEVLLQVIAGSDTSATTIRVVILFLLMNPVAYKKLQTEIDNAIAAGKVSSPITDAEGKKLPYLQAVIKEALRIMPPATGIFFKTVPPGGDEIGGKFVPAGTQVGSSAFAVHLSKEVFGPDAEIFRPERWLEATGERLTEMLGRSELIFHYGKYQCPGRPVALMEFNKVFVELLRRFDFSINNPEKPVKIKNAGIWMIKDIWLRITRRDTQV